LSLFTLELDNY